MPRPAGRHPARSSAQADLEYTDIAVDAGQPRQRWLGRYMKHLRNSLLASRFRYLEPVDVGRWAPIALNRADRLSFYFCSAYGIGKRSGELCP